MRISVVEEGKGKELSNQAHLCREEKGRPRHSSSNDTNRVSGVALVSAKASPFKTPVDRTQEGDDRGSVTELNGLNDVQKLLSNLAGEEKTLAVRCGVLNVESEVDCGERSRKVSH